MFVMHFEDEKCDVSAKFPYSITRSPFGTQEWPSVA